MGSRRAESDAEALADHATQAVRAEEGFELRPVGSAPQTVTTVDVKPLCR